MIKTHVYVLFNPFINNWVEPVFRSQPWLSFCTGFRESEAPFFTNEQAYKLLVDQDAPGIEMVELRVAEVTLMEK